MQKQCNRKIILQICLVVYFLVFTGTHVQAEKFFAGDSTWYRQIPSNPVLAPYSAEYINDLISNSDKFTVSSREYSYPVWQAAVDTTNVTVMIDAQDFVWLYNGSSYTNNTVEAQTTGGTPFNLMSDINHWLYIGDTLNKNEIIFILNTLGANYTLTDAGSVQYSTGEGTWSDVTNLNDGTSGFSAYTCITTDCRLSFTQPGDWAKATVNNIGGRYWLRIKTTTNPTVATAKFMAFADNDGETALRGWNILPWPTGAKGAGQDTLSCPNYPATGNNFDGHLVILSYDGKWEWDMYAARKCPANTLPAQYQSDPTALAWHAGTVRKRARTTAAATEESFGTWGGSGVGPVFENSTGVYSQDDLNGNNRACGPDAVTHGLITKADYDSGVINHAIAFSYSGEKQYPSHWGHYPCLSYRLGAVDRPYAMYMGRRIQLSPSFVCNTMTGANNFSKMVCEALKTYGAILVDTTGVGYNEFYAESVYGKSDFWSGIIQAPIPGFPVDQLRVVEPICDDPRVCPNNNGSVAIDSTSPDSPKRLAIVATPSSILSNPGFESGTSPWVFYTNGTGTLAADAASNGSAYAGHVVITTAGTNVQVYQANAILEPNTLYQLSFKAYSNTGHDVWVALHKHVSTYTNYGLGQAFDLTASWQDYSVQFITTGFSNTVYDGRLVFLLSSYNVSGDEYFFDDVMLTKLGAVN